MIKSVINFELVRYAEWDEDKQTAIFYFTPDDVIERRDDHGRKTYHAFQEYILRGCAGYTPYPLGGNETPEPVAAGTPARKQK